jgi:hypothetical protein
MTSMAEPGLGHVNSPGIAPNIRSLVISLTSLYTVSLVLVILRFAAKRHDTKIGLGLEDWTSLAAFICLTAYYGETIFIAVNCYAGWHASQLYLWQIEKFLRVSCLEGGYLIRQRANIEQYVYANNICYAITLPMIKLSILATYRRLFFINKGFQRVSVIVAALVVGWMISVTIVVIFTCNPIAGAWIRTINRTCINQTAFYYGNAILNVITDIILLVMPLPMIWKLNMSMRKKVNVTLLFILGSL